ncbi:protein of unknown function [Sporobacter termitidis DSM 10068]|uniref:Transcobalamin-like C-terminal domain-containing protein n=1 Tax=Sporobacter termitidis DSM 10068 TaxID=1123282 RepID=A0A1M5YR03_9FIRM|nr:DUF4430 domain-containing protein [Sporobacter termitidis]SHI14294.1 protein of unknown function [Sporobacter termitidis DSM 10068]
MKRLKTSVVAVLTLALILGLSLTAFAASGDLTITSGSTTFTKEQVDVYNPNEGITYSAYSDTGIMPVGTNLSNLPVTISFEGTALKIDGVTVATSTPYTGSIDFLDKSHEIEVVYAAGSHVHHAAAYITGTAISATVNFDYENARTFSELDVDDAYGVSPYTDPVDATQKALATAAVSALDSKVLGDYSDSYSNVVAGSNAKDILTTYANLHDNLFIEGTASYVSAIEGLGEETTGMYYGMIGTGGWMYTVTRGGDTFFPSVAATLWKLQPGDVITWHYTCDWGYDLDYPMM